jgi:hypothetical protein
MNILGQGHLSKMPVKLSETVDGKVSYKLQLGDEQVDLNQYLGQKIQIKFDGQINCKHCGRKTKKSFSQGYCYPCFTKLAQCDRCMMSPEHCHFHLGTCREPEWGEQFCFRSHYVYLANSSGVKVGITRGTQIPTRWIDQGAIQALPIFKVASRHQSGLIERVIGEQVSDKTNWRVMLKGGVGEIDLIAERDRLFESCYEAIEEIQQEFGLQAIQHLYDAEVVNIDYPVLNYPLKVTSQNLDKTPLVEGVLQGIKGQYLILDTGVINIRKFSAYLVQVSVGE